MIRCIWRLYAKLLQLSVSTLGLWFSVISDSESRGIQPRIRSVFNVIRELLLKQGTLPGRILLIIRLSVARSFECRMIILLAEEPDAPNSSVLILDSVLQPIRERKMKSDTQGQSLSRASTKLSVAIINLSQLDGTMVMRSIAIVVGVPIIG